MLKEKNHQSQILYPAKLYFQNKEKLRLDFLRQTKMEGICYQDLLHKECKKFFREENCIGQKLTYIWKEGRVLEKK